jgi:hypothetical protein
VVVYTIVTVIRRRTSISLSENLAGSGFSGRLPVGKIHPATPLNFDFWLTLTRPISDSKPRVSPLDSE